MITAEELARLFHETYERLAPEFGYETRPESATSWDRVPDNNKHLMTATAEVVITELADRYGVDGWNSVMIPMPPEDQDPR